MVVSGRGSGFCGGYDLSLFAEQGGSPVAAAAAAQPAEGTVLDPVAQARNHDPSRPWDPMVDYAMMSRFNRGFASLLHADKPTVAKLHGFCVAGGSDIALFADQIVAASDTKIGYPPARVWGIPAAGMWAHRVGDQRAKRLLFTGDTITGAEAYEWGLAVEAPAPADLDERTEILLERIARMPLSQLMMAKLALNSALLAQGVATSGLIGTVFDGVARHTREGHGFVEEAVRGGFRSAVRQRDEPFGDTGRTVFRG
jgi:enoyl-CoA hydratase